MQLAFSAPPTAILCYNDLTVIGLLHTLSGHGLRVPEDISVIGFDDIHMARFTVQPLTTIRMSCADLARVALDLIPLISAGMIASSVQTSRTIPTRLVVRQSTNYPSKDDSHLPAEFRLSKKSQYMHRVPKLITA